MSNDTEKPVIDELEPPQMIEEGPSLPALLTDDFVKQFEKGIETYKRWVSACYRLTREGHWIKRKTREGGFKYVLQGPGAEALMNPLGISFERPTFKREDREDSTGAFYIYWCEGYVESRTLGRRGYYIGYCDSRDQFFVANSKWNAKTGEGDIKKSSYTNWVVNSVTRIAGIRDPDEAMLVGAGLKTAAIPEADYAGRKTPEDDHTLISEPQRKRLWAICKSQNVSEEILRVYLLDTYKFKSTSEVTRGAYEAICAWADRGGQEEPK